MSPWLLRWPLYLIMLMLCLLDLACLAPAPGDPIGPVAVCASPEECQVEESCIDGVCFAGEGIALAVVAGLE